MPTEGGLYVPDHMPELSEDFLQDLAGLDFIGRAEKILTLFAPDLSPEEVSQICSSAWPEALGLDPDEHFIRSHKLSDYLTNPVFCFLTRGRTGSYLDYVQSFLLACARTLTEAGETCYLLAGESFAGVRSLAALDIKDARLKPLLLLDRKLADNFSLREIQLLYHQALAGGTFLLENASRIEPDYATEEGVLPADLAGQPAEETPSLLNAEALTPSQLTESQEKFLIDLPEFSEEFCRDNSLRIYSLKGQPEEVALFKERLLADPDLRRDLAQEGKYICHLGNLNFAYYIALLIIMISAYFDLRADGWLEKDQDFVLAFPNNDLDFLYLSILLKELGLPISSLLLADSSNSCLVDFLRTDRYKKNRKFSRSYTPDLDRFYYPNLERFIFEIVNRDADRSSQAMENLEADKPAGIANILQAFRSVIIANKISNKQVLDQIQNWYKRTDYLFDPYTALTLELLEKQKRVRLDKSQVLVLSLEHPLLSSGPLASVILGKKNTRKSSFLNNLGALAEETGLAVPLAACAGQNKPDLVLLEVSQGLDFLYRELLGREPVELLVEKESPLQEENLSQEGSPDQAENLPGDDGPEKPTG